MITRLTEGRLALLAPILVATTFQISRLPFRWNQISLAYAAYFHEARWAFREDGLTGLLTTWVGIHPPLYSTLFVGLMALDPPALAWHLLSGFFSVLAVVLLARAATGPRSGSTGLIAAWLFAVSPHRTAYGIEPNNYPLLVLLTVLQWRAWSRWSTEGTRRAGILWGLVTAAALWTHVLAVLLPVSQLLTSFVCRGDRTRTALAALLPAVLCLPLIAPALQLAGGPPINDPPGLAAALANLTLLLPTRYGSGIAAWIVVILTVFGALSDRRELRPFVVHLVLGSLGILVLMAIGVASATQLPYWLAVLPSVILLAAEGASRLARLGTAAVTGVVLLNSASLGWDAVRGVHGFLDAPISHAVVRAGLRHWTPGTPLVTLHFAEFQDDDKDGIDPAWAHFPILRRLHFVDSPLPLVVAADPYWGQPVLADGDRWWFTFTELDESRWDSLFAAYGALGQPVLVIAWNGDHAPDEFARLGRWIEAHGGDGSVEAGQAWWWVPPGRSSSLR